MTRDNRFWSLALVAAVSCQPATAATRDAVPAATSFDTNFVEIGRPVALADPDSIGLVSGALLLNGRLFVIDQRHGELRSFSRATGQLVEVVARAGDEPGDLRDPIAIAALSSHRFVIYDAKRRLLSFRDGSGRLERETKVEPGNFNDLIAMQSGTILLAGVPYSPNSPARAHDLHQLDSTGHYQRSISRYDPPASDWQRRFGATFLAHSGPTAILGTMSSRTLRLVNASANTERRIAVAPSWRPTDWPPDRQLQRVADHSAADVLTPWLHHATLMNGVFALPHGKLLARFQSFDPDARRYFSYVVLDTTGRTLAVTHGTRNEVVAAHGDTLDWIRHEASRLLAGTSTCVCR